MYIKYVICCKVNGAQVKEWLEMSAGQFNQIDQENRRTAVSKYRVILHITSIF